ncbi:hypothetical protein [Chondrinema litorale]|uniref:hypothetical protein n=1 Tax=Chondrinema litorale TaxID=2994555 RepID=UPI002543EA0D|nr:hypothetical protein [Chondrinema litorale]UZR94773.1 hypothetical protein OQ292_02950 [Chondrinema litorale]
MLNSKNTNEYRREFATRMMNVYPTNATPNSNYTQIIQNLLGLLHPLIGYSKVLFTKVISKRLQKSISVF